MEGQDIMYYSYPTAVISLISQENLQSHSVISPYLNYTIYTIRDHTNGKEELWRLGVRTAIYVLGYATQ